MKQEIAVNRGQLKKTPKIFFWRYWWIFALLVIAAVIVAIVKL